MAGERSGYGNQTGRVSIGFAKDAPGSVFASNAPRVGFAAAMRSATAEMLPGTAVEEQRPITKKPTPSNATPVDKEHARKSREYVAPKLIAIAAGRRIHLAKRGNDWRGFQEHLGAVNRPLFRALSATQLMLKYLTDPQMADLVAARFPADRPIAQGKANAEIRDVMSRLNNFSEREQARDLVREQKILSASPDLAQMAMDPDNPKWFEGENAANHIVSREQISAWLPADFYAAETKITGASTVSVALKDASGVLLRGRNQFIDAMGDKKYGGFDVSGVSPDWQPEIELMRSIGGRSLDGVEYHVPRMPLIMPLKEPHVYEI